MSDIPSWCPLVSKTGHLDCFGLQFETVERVDGLVRIVWIHVVDKSVSQTLTWRRGEKKTDISNRITFLVQRPQTKSANTLFSYLWFCPWLTCRIRFLRCYRTNSWTPPGSCSEADSLRSGWFCCRPWSRWCWWLDRWAYWFRLDR